MKSPSVYPLWASQEEGAGKGEAGVVRRPPILWQHLACLDGRTHSPPRFVSGKGTPGVAGCRSGHWLIPAGRSGSSCSSCLAGNSRSPSPSSNAVRIGSVTHSCVSRLLPFFPFSAFSDFAFLPPFPLSGFPFLPFLEVLPPFLIGGSGCQKFEPPLPFHWFPVQRLKLVLSLFVN